MSSPAIGDVAKIPSCANALSVTHGSTCLCRGRKWLQLVCGLIRTKPMNDLGADGAPQA
jgi:hypothetical protein